MTGRLTNRGLVETKQREARVKRARIAAGTGQRDSVKEKTQRNVLHVARQNISKEHHSAKETPRRRLSRNGRNHPRAGGCRNDLNLRRTQSREKLTATVCQD